MRMTFPLFIPRNFLSNFHLIVPISYIFQRFSCYDYFLMFMLTQCYNMASVFFPLFQSQGHDTIMSACLRLALLEVWALEETYLYIAVTRAYRHNLGRADCFWNCSVPLGASFWFRISGPQIHTALPRLQVLHLL